MEDFEYVMGAEQIREKRQKKREDDKECSFTTLLRLRFCISLIN